MRSWSSYRSLFNVRRHRSGLELGLSGPSQWMLAVFVWIIFSIAFGLCFLLFVVDSIPLGPDFGLAIAVTLADAVCTGLWLTLALMLAGEWLRRKRVIQPSQGSRRRLGRWRYVVLSCLLAVGIIFTVAFFLWSNEQVARIHSDADSARQEFRVVTDGEDLDQSRVNHTLAEFERARRRLRWHWPAPNSTPPLSLTLFKDLQQYQSRTSLMWSAGGSVCQDDVINIYVPLEETSNILELGGDDPSRVPIHEMVHAAMCRSLGAHGYHSVPTWFREGMAKLYENDGESKRVKRVEDRMRVWFKRDGLLEPGRFCDKPDIDSAAALVSFYQTTHECIRFLEARHGRRTLNRIVAGIQFEVEFEEKLRDQYGGTCIDLYAAWTKSF